jgi:malate dehydrogenase (oxaloacetate-decarboxylating)
LAKKPHEARLYTIKKNTVAVISDGTAVLGLGDVGPIAALPVLEGKALIFKEMADVDAYPIALGTKDIDSIVETIKNIAPGFGGINLEDISAPRCFAIEERLKKELDIPVMHDDQHGTAIVVLAGLINACKVAKRNLNTSRIVLNGVGAAGIGVIRLIKQFAPKVTIIAVDTKGIIGRERKDLNDSKQSLLTENVIDGGEDGDLAHALQGADIFIGLSKGNILNQDMIKNMKQNPIIFALANPVPEILPEVARQAGAGVVATGRSDFPNQVNNALVFPGVFRGALDREVKQITDKMKLNAARALANMIKKPHANLILPLVWDKKVVKVVAAAIR